MTQTSRQFYPICTCATTKHTNVIFICNVVCVCWTRNARRPFASRAFVDARRRPAALSTVAIHFLDHIPFKLLQPNTRRAQFLFFLFLLLLRFLLLWQRHTFVDDDDNFPPSPMEHKHNTKHFEYKSKKEGYLEFIMINSLNAGISSRSHQPPTKHNT